VPADYWIYSIAAIVLLWLAERRPRPAGVALSQG
jgi:hypothetical protein